MTGAAAIALAAVLAAGAAPPPSPVPATAVRRLVLIAAANRGGEDRPVLKYAVTDAERFNQVMQALGGVDAGDVILLTQPRVGELDAALDSLRQRVASARRSGQAGTAVRTEVFFYYSGHADEKGLLLGNDRLSYATVRERLAAVPADLRIGILDACASGAITRPKGGKVRSPFTVDQSSDMRGQAFLASSSADESAQESDRLGASFFTHYLISGLRGAADVSGDGRVTLNEAYQFAFSETLSRTVGTKGGPQHPVYDITMSGTGEVIMTDLRQTTAGFVVPATIDGRFYVLDERKRLVVEFLKPAGRKITVGLEPGIYEVRFEREPRALRARLEIREGAHQALDIAAFAPASLEFTRLRGIDTGPEYLLRGRHMLNVRLGMWNRPGDTPGTGAPDGFAGSYVSAGRGTVAIEYVKFVREDLGLGTAIQAMVDSAESVVSGTTARIRGRIGVNLPIVVRWNPVRSFSSGRALEPYVRGSVGPLLAVHNTIRTSSNESVSETVVDTTVGGSVGAGVDVRINPSWTVGVNAARHFSGAVQELGVDRSRYAGWGITFGFAVIIGSGSSQEQ